MDKLAADRVFALVTQIPAGKVATYKQLATPAHLTNPRQVGKILNHHPDSKNYPCHRVIRSDGTVAEGADFGERFGQIIMLRQEGVEFLGGRVNLTHYGWQPELPE